MPHEFWKVFRQGFSWEFSCNDATWLGTCGNLQQPHKPSCEVWDLRFQPVCSKTITREINSLTSPSPVLPQESTKHCSAWPQISPQNGLIQSKSMFDVSMTSDYEHTYHRCPGSVLTRFTSQCTETFVSKDWRSLICTIISTLKKRFHLWLHHSSNIN